MRKRESSFKKIRTERVLRGFLAEDTMLPIGRLYFRLNLAIVRKDQIEWVDRESR